jgi:hypothetical protein
LEWSYSVWYSDVDHEVKPITGGHRLLLIYNLVQSSSGPIPTESISTGAKGSLKNVLSRWNTVCNRDNSDIPRMLAYKLSYKYSKSSLSFESLKGRDHVMFRQLDEACKDEDFLLYLAHIKKEDTGGCDEDDEWDGNGRFGYGYSEYEDDADKGEDEDEDGDDADEEDQRYASKNTVKDKVDLGDCHEIIESYESSIQLTRFIDQNRTEVAKDADFDVEYIAQGNMFKRAPDYEDYTGYTGNEGVSTTHFYHDTVVLLLPQSSHVEFLYNSATQDSGLVLSWIERLQDDLFSKSGASTRRRLERLCDLILQQTRKTSSASFSYARVDGYSGMLVEAVVTAALKLDDVLLLEEALQLLGEPHLKVLDSIRQAIPRLGFVTLKPALEIAFSHMTSISSRRFALLRIAGRSSLTPAQPLDATERVVEDWIKDRMGSMLGSLPKVTANDGISLSDMTESVSLASMKQGIVPFIES